VGRIAGAAVARIFSAGRGGSKAGERANRGGEFGVTKTDVETARQRGGRIHVSKSRDCP
jgi:hypothetical protein